MRDDMFKVLAERPRKKPFKSLKKPNKPNKYNLEMDLLPGLESIRPKGPRKWLPEYLSPLYRFLQSKVGANWNSVYSELRQNLNPKNSVNLQVVRHAKIAVKTETYIADGKVHGYGIGCLEEPIRFQWFYVHPITGILCESPRMAKEKKEKEKKIFRLTDLCQYRLIDGIWYCISLEVIPRGLGKLEKWVFGIEYKPKTSFALDYSNVKDVLFPQGLTNQERQKQYGFCNLRVKEKRQLGTRELKKLQEAL